MTLEDDYKQTRSIRLYRDGNANLSKSGPENEPDCAVAVIITSRSETNTVPFVELLPVPCVLIVEKAFKTMLIFVHPVEGPFPTILLWTNNNYYRGL